MRRRDERGASSLLVLAMCGVVVFLGFGLVAATAIVRTHRSAQAAADLAALAGAEAAVHGRAACPTASDLAGRNGSRLVDCTVAGTVVTVEVEVVGPRIVGRRFDVSAQARAGPGAG